MAKNPKSKGSGDVIPFVTREAQTSKDASEGEVIDHGDIGGLQYEVYRRGNVHVFDNKYRFKKDSDSFWKLLQDVDLDEDSEETVIVGAGDTDDLVLLRGEKDEVEVALRRKGLAVIEQLKRIVGRGRKSKTTSS